MHVFGGFPWMASIFSCLFSFSFLLFPDSCFSSLMFFLIFEFLPHFVLMACTRADRSACLTANTTVWILYLRGQTERQQYLSDDGKGGRWLFHHGMVCCAAFHASLRYWREWTKTNGIHDTVHTSYVLSNRHYYTKRIDAVTHCKRYYFAHYD